MDENGMKATLASVISTMMTLINKNGKQDLFDKKNPDHRQQIEDQISALLYLRPDPECWSTLVMRPPYDEYLHSRRKNGTVTRIDLIRPGLMAADFSMAAEMEAHKIRIAEEKNERGEKLCTGCNTVKPMSAFRTGMGAQCNSCRGKRYRKAKEKAS